MTPKPVVTNIDCLKAMVAMDDDSVDIIVTSPPYKEEDGFHSALMMSLAQYCSRVLKPGGLVFLNFGHLADHKYRPFLVAHYFENLGHFIWVDTITWVKNHYKPVQGNKRQNNLSEFIFIFAKGKDYKLNRLAVGIPYKDKSNVGRFADKDLKCRGNVWYINYPTIQHSDQKSHKDRFPVELPETCIKLSGIKKGSLVFDPFAGSATTGVAAMNLGMKFIGTEINKKVCRLANQRLKRGEG